MNNIKTFDQLNEEIFGIGKNVKNKDLVGEITGSIFDNQDKIRTDTDPDDVNGDHRISFSCDIPSGSVEIESPLGLIGSNKLVAKLNGEEIELNQNQKNSIQQQLRNYSPSRHSSGSKRPKVKAMFGEERVQAFREFKK
jgi:hypothetical protein